MPYLVFRSLSLQRNALATLIISALLSACNSPGSTSPAPADDCATDCRAVPPSENRTPATRTEDTPPRNTDNSESGSRTRALWVWGSKVVLDSDARNQLFAFAAEKSLNRFYLEASEALRYDQDALAAFFTISQQRGIAVELLFGQPDWALPENHHQVASIIDRVADFAARYPDLTVAAIHLDVEPYLLTEWETERPELIASFIDLLESARSRTHRIGLPLYADIPIWFDEHGIFRNGQARTLHELVIDATDGVGLMDYRDTAERIINDASNELTYADRQGKPVVVGVETLCIEPTWITFCEEGSDYMDDVLHSVESELKSYSSYQGIAIHHFDSYRILQP